MVTHYNRSWNRKRYASWSMEVGLRYIDNNTKIKVERNPWPSYVMTQNTQTALRNHKSIALFQVFALFQRQYIDFKPKSSLYSVKFAIFVRNKYNMLYGKIESYQRCTWWKRFHPDLVSKTDGMSFQHDKYLLQSAFAAQPEYALVNKQNTECRFERLDNE